MERKKLHLLFKTDGSPSECGAFLPMAHAWSCPWPEETEDQTPPSFLSSFSLPPSPKESFSYQCPYPDRGHGVGL